MKKDINSYVEFKANPISKAGVFDYLGSQITLADGSHPEPLNKIYKVLRSEETLKQAAESFELVPVIDDHTFLGSEDDGYTRPEAKGVQGVIANLKMKGGELLADVKVFSQRLINKIKDGKIDLSLGYRCSYKRESGVFNGEKYDFVQTDMIGNHLALVDNSRCDVALAMDSAGGEVFHVTLGDKEMTLDEVIEKLHELTKEVQKLKGDTADEVVETEAKPVEETKTKAEETAEDEEVDAEDEESEEVKVEDEESEEATEDADISLKTIYDMLKVISDHIKTETVDEECKTEDNTEEHKATAEDSKPEQVFVMNKSSAKQNKVSFLDRELGA